mgnify:CR=1 FL=1
MKVVVTLTSIPSREKNVIKTVKSIQNGTVLPDCIYVNLSNYYPKFKKSPSEDVVRELKSMGVIVNMTDEYGTLNDIMPILNTEKDSIAVIVTDNAEYSMAGDLLKGYEEFGCAVGYSGICYPERVMNAYGRLGYVVSGTHGERTDILETTLGFLIPINQLKVPEKLDIEPMKEPEPIYFSNDYVWSRFLEKKVFVKYDKIGRYGDDFSKIFTPVEAQPEHSLSGEGNNLSNFFKSRTHKIFNGLGPRS